MRDFLRVGPVAILVTPLLTGCWANMGDVSPRTWIVEAYVPDETVGGASMALGELAERLRLLNLERYDGEAACWRVEDVPPEAERVHLFSQTMMDRVWTEIVIVDLGAGAGLRFVFNIVRDDDEDMRVVFADLMEELTERYGSLNVAARFDGRSPGLLLCKWQPEGAGC